MHTLVVTDKSSYKQIMPKIVADLSHDHAKGCYISFNDPYHIVVEMLEDANVHHKYIIVDASTGTKEITNINNSTYVVSLQSLFDVYIFLANIIKQEKISLLLLDSLSALIDKHATLPLKDMMTNFLLQVGSMKCSTSLIVFNHHENHEVVSHLNPFFSRNFRI